MINKVLHNHFYKKSSILLFFLLTIQTVLGSTITQTNTPVPVNAINPLDNFTILDDELGNPNVVSENISSYVRLYVDNNIVSPIAFKYTIDLEIIPLNPDGTDDTANLTNKTLEVNYSPFAGMFFYADLAHYDIENRYGLKVRVLDFQTINTDSNAVVAEPSGVFLELGFKADRYYRLTEVLPSIAVNENFDASSTNPLSIQIEWTPIQGAEEYELEWTWVDNYGLSGVNSEVPANDIYFTSRDFELNSTRIQTKNTNYEIPLTYSRGYVLYRLRGVGRFLENTSKLFYGEWTDGATNKVSIQDWIAAAASYKINTAHENLLNWQFQASYAEEGKKKEVISYFSGDLRNRQTVTVINSDDNAVIGETKYDVQGRPAIEILPVPTANNKLRFYPDFNLNRQGKNYNHLDFDWDEPASDDPVCEIDLNGMSIQEGAAKYYSNNNDSQAGQEKWFQDYVPSSQRNPNSNQGFPFSQIEYTPDNTGRIKRKGGVGPKHQLGSGHEMKYLYESPSQYELTRLFGDKVGNVNHYKKNTVVDPNGQISISYIDPQGRTIATALAGNTPNNNGNDILLGLDDEDEATGFHGYVQSDLLNKANIDDVDTLLDSNDKFSTNSFGNLIDGLRHDSYKSILVDGTQPTFNYDVRTPSTFELSCEEGTFGYPFVYDLKIDVQDECGASYEGLPIERTIGDYTTTTATLYEESLDENPNAEVVGTYDYVNLEAQGELFEELTHTIFPNKGTIGIHKAIQVNTESLEKYLEDYRNRLTDPNQECFVDPGPFSPNVSLSDCFVTCEECVEAIGINDTQDEAQAQDAYVALKLTEYDYSNIPADELDDFVALLTIRFEREFELLLAECNSYCDSGAINVGANGTATLISTLLYENAVNNLLSDMALSGQYGEVEFNDAGEALTSNNITELDIYNEGNLFPTQRIADILGITIPVGTSVSWRTPYHYIYDIANTSNTTIQDGHYYDPYGAIAYVIVEESADNPGTYTPALQAGAPVITEFGLTKVEPQYLENVADFKTFMDNNDSWIESLILFHPEFSYLSYLKSVTDYTFTADVSSASLGYSQIEMNSEGYDAFLDNLSFTNAKDLGFFTPNGTTGGFRKIMELDPYFDNQFSIDYNHDSNPPPFTIFDQRYVIMAQALEPVAPGYESGYENTGLPMLRFSYNLIACQGLTACATTQADLLNLISSTNSSDIPLKEELWDRYRSLYKSLKQKIDYVMHNTHTFGYGAYNGCIDAGNTPTSILNVISSYELEAYAISEYIGYVNSIALQYQYCTLNPAVGLLHVTKNKRFVPIDDLYDSGQSAGAIVDDLMDGSNYDYYALTGECPKERDLGFLLDGLFKDITTISDLTSGFEYQNTLYLTPDLYAALGGTITADQGLNSLTIEGTVSGNDLIISFSSNPPQTFSEITLTIPTNSNGVTWNNYGQSWDINAFTMLTFTGDNAVNNALNDFSALAVINLPPSSETQLVLTGTTATELQCSLDGTVGEDLSDGANADNDPSDTNGNSGGDADSGVYDNDCNKVGDFETAYVALLNYLISVDAFSAGFYTLADTSGTVDSHFGASYLYNFFGVNVGDEVVWKINNGNQFLLYHNSDIVARADFATFIQTLVTNGTVNQFTSMTIDFFSSNNNFEGEMWYTNSSLEFSNIGLTKESFVKGNFECCEEVLVPFCDEASFEVGFLRLLNNLLSQGDLFSSNVSLTNNAIYTNSYMPIYLGDTAYQAEYDFILSGTLSRFTINLGSQTVFQAFTQSADISQLDIVEFLSFNFTNKTSNPYEYELRYINNQGQIVTVPDGLIKENFVNFDCDSGYDDDQRTDPLTTSEGDLVTQLVCDEVGCVPQSIVPIACNDIMFTEYQQVMASISNYDIPEIYLIPQADGASLTDIERLSMDYFCDMKFVYILEGYKEYLEVMGVAPGNGTDNLHFISIADFGATALNYGYNDYSTVVNAFADYITSVGDYQDYYEQTGEAPLNWGAFANQYLDNNPSICPPAMIPQLIDAHITPPDLSDCEEMTLNVQEAYNAAAYNAYIDSLVHEFKQDYLAAAFNQMVEHFTMESYDKEYQYTLYYYDQGGNLMKTLSPEGVVRDEDLTDANTEPNHIEALATEYKYNSLNQLVWQQTPDGGITKFAYDDLGRIIASQNARQANESGQGVFSYTNYDGLGRIVEAGEIVYTTSAVTYQITTEGRLERNTSSGTELVNSFDTAFAQKNEVTQTIYDTALTLTTDASGNPTSTSADLFETAYESYNSRNRVNAVVYFNSMTSATLITDFNNAIFYNYDVHGNVKELIQQNNDMFVDNETFHIKRTQYDYDLISGNVHMVTYQKGAVDQYMHKYTYDADNRIVDVQTSKDGHIWEKDAAYQYYDHGPLARAEIGDKQSQGIDYRYTLQGWLKSVNSESLRKEDDAGNDGVQAGSNPNVARDAYGYTLGYYNKDYTPRHTMASVYPNNPEEFSYSSNNAVIGNGSNLYNGNIRHMVTGVRNISTNGDINTVYGSKMNYKYDQLNRIKRMNGATIDRTNDNVQTSAAGALKARYSYDRNGNLTDLRRWDPSNPNHIDNLRYQYHRDPVTGRLVADNKLRIVRDNAGQVYPTGNKDLMDQFSALGITTGAFNADPTNEDNHNYVYDELGQLIEDKTENLQIKWRVDGKVSEITSAGRAVTFNYDGLGNRIAKTDNRSFLDGPITTTFYVRDAQGNVMAVYERGNTGGRNGTPFYDLKEHHIYGSSRLGIEQRDYSFLPAKSGGDGDIIILDPGGLRNNARSISSTPEVFNTANTATYGINIASGNYAEWAEVKRFYFGQDQNYTFSADVKISGNLAEEENFIAIVKQLQGNRVARMYLSVREEAGLYYPTLVLRRERAHNVFGLTFSEKRLELDNGLSSPNFKVDYSFTSNTAGNFADGDLLVGQVIITDENGVVVTYTIGNGLSEVNTLGPIDLLNFNEPTATRIGFTDPTSSYSFKVCDFSYSVRGFIRDYDFTEANINSGTLPVIGATEQELNLTLNGTNLLTECTVEVVDETDTDGDGVFDVVDLDDDNDGVPDSVEGTADVDGDLLPNRLDPDSDDDSLFDIEETNLSTGISYTNGVIDAAVFVDTNNDGWHDPIQNLGATPVIDTDTDSLQNFVDADDDNDGILTFVERDDIVNGGQIDDPDQDNLPNHLDPDDDNDTVLTIHETEDMVTYYGSPLGARADLDQDGIMNYLDVDDDGDNYHTFEEDYNNDDNPRNDDTDGDTVPEYIDNGDGLFGQPLGEIAFNEYIREVGDKKYELSNHLGNVLAVVTDRKLPQFNGNNGNLRHYTPEVEQYTEYYPFGMVVPGRTASSTNYRYGFNGIEKDDEVKGEGNHYDYGARMYDPRVGRFLSLDPLSTGFPYESNYNYVSNNPLIYKDPDGKAKILTLIITDKETGSKLTIAVVVDEWAIARGARRREVFGEGTFFEAGHTEYSYEWHDINITQNVTRELDGSFTINGDPVTTLGETVLAKQQWEWAAKGEIILRRIDENLPGEGEAVILQWLTGNGEDVDLAGIDFYSKKGEGSGVRAKDPSKVGYVDGDALIALLKAGGGVAKGRSDKTSADNNPSTTKPGKWKGSDEVSKELNSVYSYLKDTYKALKRIEKQNKQAKKITEKVEEFVEERKVEEIKGVLNSTRDKFFSGGKWIPLKNYGPESKKTKEDDEGREKSPRTFE